MSHASTSAPSVVVRADQLRTFTARVLDTANSTITWTAIHDYEERGQPLPEGLALDPAGRPTTDPAAALAGRVLPLGGPKGSGLAMLWEVLTGVLSGGPLFGPHVVGPDRVSTPQS